MSRSRLGPPRLGVAIALLALAATVSPPPAAASDFWDAVRSPERGRERALLERARLALRAHRYDEALVAADAAVSVAPDAAEAHRVRGLALGELGRRDEALEAFARALELDPRALDDPEEGARAAELAAVAGDPELAATILERVLGRMAPGRRRRTLYTLQGDVLLALGPAHLREALVAYREALRDVTPPDPRAVLGLALALDRAGEDAEARGLLARLEGVEGLELIIGRSAVPPSERAARLALLREAEGDRGAARTAWREAAAGEAWRAHAEDSLEALDGPAEAR